MNKYLIYLLGLIALFSMVPTVSAWNVLFKSSSVTTVWYYPNSTYPIYIPVGFVNQSIYIENIPITLETSNFTLYFSALNSSGYVSNTVSKEVSFIPYSTSFALPASYFERSGEYTIKAPDGVHSEFLLFNRTTIPSELYNSSASAIILYNSTLQNQLRSINATTSSNANQISKINSELNALVGNSTAPNSLVTNVNSLKSTVGWLVIAIVILFILMVFLFLFLYKKHKDTEEIYNVRSTYGQGTTKYYKDDAGAPDSGSTPSEPDTSSTAASSSNQGAGKEDVWPGEEKYKGGSKQSTWTNSSTTTPKADSDNTQTSDSGSREYDSGITEE